MMSKLLNGLFVILVVVLFTHAAWAQNYKVGATPTGVPFTFLDTKTNSIQGVMVDLIQAVAKDQGFTVEIQGMPFNTLIPSLQTSKIDIISCALGITPQRAEVVDFSSPVYTYGEGVVVSAKDTKEYKSYDEFKGELVGVQVGTPQGARLAREDGADFVICQGVEAGGHVQSTWPLSRLLPAVVQACGDLPVVAAGGLADAADIAAALAVGAQAVMLGTRFIATVESRAHPLYKQALVDAKADDVVLTVCFSDAWPNAAHRVLRNSTLQAWEAAGCPPRGARPGEGDLLATSHSGRTLVRYDDTPAASDMEGDIEACIQYAGLGCERIHDIPSVPDLLVALWRRPA